MFHIYESYVHVCEVDHPRNTSPKSGRMVRDEEINNDEGQSMPPDAKSAQGWEQSFAIKNVPSWTYIGNIAHITFLIVFSFSCLSVFKL